MKRYQIQYTDDTKLDIEVVRFFVSPETGRRGCCSEICRTVVVRLYGMKYLRRVARNMIEAASNLITYEYEART